jgi:hypothetical protein
MHVATRNPFLGIEDRVLVLNANERKTLARADALLDRMREIVGPDTDLGTDLGKGMVVCHEYGDADEILIETKSVPIGEITLRMERTE